MPTEHRWKDLVARADALAADGWNPKDCIPWLHEFIDLTLRLHSRPDLIKLKEDNSEHPVLPALIDQHLADRFWKYGEHPDDSKAPD
jgi:hypothetical protein